MISVIIPVYKAEKTIARCIESVIAQEYKDWELILVDDGSPDRSGEVCEEYSKNDVRIRVVHQENGGVSIARNQGIKNAYGDLICFIDSDDYVSPDYLSAFCNSGDYDLIVQGMTLTYSDSVKNHTKVPQIDESVSLIELISKDSATLNLLQGPCCKLFRKSILIDRQILFPVGLSYGEDSIFIMEYLLSCQRIKLISCSNYFYTHEENSVSLSAKKHDYTKLYRSIEINYGLYCRLQKRFGSLPPSFVQYYKYYNSFTYYNAIHNAILSNESNLEKVHFLDNRNEEAIHFFSTCNKLPLTYQIIRILDCLLPNKVLVSVFPSINKFLGNVK